MRLLLVQHTALSLKALGFFVAFSRGIIYIFRNVWLANHDFKGPRWRSVPRSENLIG
jgi:hypothetical protein